MGRSPVKIIFLLICLSLSLLLGYYSALCSLPYPDKPAVCWFQQLQLFPIISRKKHRVNSCVYSPLQFTHTVCGQISCSHENLLTKGTEERHFMSKNELRSSGERRRRVLRMARVNGNKFTCTDQPACFALRRWIHFTSSTMGTTSTLKSSATRYSAGSTLRKAKCPGKQRDLTPAVVASRKPLPLQAEASFSSQA